MELCLDITNTTIGYTIGVGNLTYSNSTDDYSSSNNMTTNYQLLFPNAVQLSNKTSYYWLNMPAVAAGKYNGTMTIMENEMS